MLSLVGKVVTEERRNGPSERKKKRKKTFYAVLIDLFALCSLDLPFALRVSIVLFFCPRYNILYLSPSRSISYWPCALCFLFSFPPSWDFFTNANLSQFVIIFFPYRLDDRMVQNLCFSQFLLRLQLMICIMTKFAWKIEIICFSFLFLLLAFYNELLRDRSEWSTYFFSFLIDCRNENQAFDIYLYVFESL